MSIIFISTVLSQHGDRNPVSSLSTVTSLISLERGDRQINYQLHCAFVLFTSYTTVPDMIYVCNKYLFTEKGDLKKKQESQQHIKVRL